MTSVARWIGGVSPGLTWTSCFGSEINSLGSGSAVQSSTVINNSSNLDLYLDVSFSITCSTGSSGSAYITFYLLPLNQDGTTYGCGGFSTGSPGAAPPNGAASYGAGSVQVNLSATTITGLVAGIVMPPGSFVLAVQNNAGVAFGASSNTIEYRTYSENLNG